MNRVSRFVLLAAPLAVLLALAFSAVPPCSAAQVASYAFDEGAGGTTADSSGNGHIGTLAFNPTWTVGKYGSALSFNASDDGNDNNDPRVVVGTSLNIPQLPFTISVWVNPVSFTDWRAILSKRDSPAASDRRFDLGLSGGSGQIYIATGGAGGSFSYTPPLGIWTHLAVVAEPGSTKLYVNGTLQQTIGGITLGTDTLSNTVIGGTGEGPGGDNDPFKGLLDDLRINDRALTQSDIQLDMQTSVAGTVTAVTLSPSVPSPLRVFPNPFRGSARILGFGREEIAVYDVSGRLVRRVRPAASGAASGVLPVDWDGTDHRGHRLPTGIYFVKAGSRIARVALLR